MHHRPKSQVLVFGPARAHAVPFCELQTLGRSRRRRAIGCAGCARDRVVNFKHTHIHTYTHTHTYTYTYTYTCTYTHTHTHNLLAHIHHFPSRRIPDCGLTHSSTTTTQCCFLVEVTAGDTFRRGRQQHHHRIVITSVVSTAKARRRFLPTWANRKWMAPICGGAVDTSSRTCHNNKDKGTESKGAVWRWKRSW